MRLDDLAPVQRQLGEPMALEEAVDLTARLDDLGGEERALLVELVDWWVARRSRYAVVGPVPSGQERTLVLVRKVVQALPMDDEVTRDLRWAVLGWLVRATQEDLRRFSAWLDMQREAIEPGATPDGGAHGGWAGEKGVAPDHFPLRWTAMWPKQLALARFCGVDSFFLAGA